MVQDAIPRPEAWPHSYETEQALLGALLVNNEVFDQVADIVAPHHFADALHGRIFEAIGTLINGGQQASVLSLGRQFDQDPALISAGGSKYLARMAASCVMIMGCADYARAIVDLWQRREAMGAAHEMMCRAIDASVDVTARDIIESLEGRLGEITASAEVGRDAVTASDAVAQAVAQTEAAMRAGTHITGVTTGLADLDKRLGGLHPADLIVLAGRPSMGKSALATNIARAVAGRPNLDERKPVYFASLEMGTAQIGQRWAAELTGISTERQRGGDVSDAEFERLIDAKDDVLGWPCLVDDSARTVAAIRSRARRMKRRYGSLGLIVIDYLQLLVPEQFRRQDNRVNEITAITVALKAMAKELDVPVLALSQLSRQVESREDKRPLLSDLRESGSIEQDADVVMFVYREEYYLDRREPKEGTDAHGTWLGLKNDAKNRGDIIVAKVRMGRIGTVKAHWNGEAGRWGDLAHHQQSMDL
jgi:replicative DNA helicase